MKYTKEDLKRIDPITHIRQHPEHYLVDGIIEGSAIVSRVMQDILTQSSISAFCAREGTWWIIASEIDWINSCSPLTVKKYFSQITPNPEVGQNAFHAEVLLTAFAEDLIVFSKSERIVINGKATPPEAVMSYLVKYPSWARSIVFQIT